MTRHNPGLPLQAMEVAEYRPSRLRYLLANLAALAIVSATFGGLAATLYLLTT